MNGKAGNTAQQGSGKKDSDEDDGEQTRKKSDKNMNNYRKIVIADDSEQERQYKSDYRGRVQDRNVSIKIEPLFAISYYEKENAVRGGVNYHIYIDELNRTGIYPKRLIITNREAPLTAEQVKLHFAMIDAHTSAILADDRNAKQWFARAVDFYLVQDFGSAVDDLTRAIAADNTFFPSYFMRALIRCKQLEYQKAELMNTEEIDRKSEMSGVDYDAVMFDLGRVIELAPDFVYAYYNRANIEAMLKDYRGAIVDYDKAIELNPSFAEAYFNRGLTHIFLGNNRQGVSDLSKAGELGMVSAYNIIKRFTEPQE
jgi:tetratricopeptide (TPR) repeat protein